MKKALRSCAEIKKHGGTTDGVYTINPDGKGAFKISCSQTKAGEAWAVIQRRLNGSVDFYRDWEDYKRGFGDLSGEFWLGLEKIHRLTSSKSQQRLRVEMEDFTGFSCYVEFDNFTVNGEDDKYRLASLGFYTGKYVGYFIFFVCGAGVLCELGSKLKTRFISRLRFQPEKAYVFFTQNIFENSNAFLLFCD